MKLQIDTQTKTIKVEEKVNLEALFETLQRFFPSGEWKEFTLETNTVINTWTNPVVIPYYPYDYKPLPWIVTTGTGYYGTSGVTFETRIQEGVYNVELSQ